MSSAGSAVSAVSSPSHVALPVSRKTQTATPTPDTVLPIADTVWPNQNTRNRRPSGARCAVGRRRSWGDDPVGVLVGTLVSLAMRVIQVD